MLDNLYLSLNIKERYSILKTNKELWREKGLLHMKNGWKK